MPEEPHLIVKCLYYIDRWSIGHLLTLPFDQRQKFCVAQETKKFSNKGTFPLSISKPQYQNVITPPPLLFFHQQYSRILAIFQNISNIPEYQNHILPFLLLFMQMVIANYTLGARRVKATASHNMLPRCSMPTDDSFKFV